jgi:hypothetical protein
MVVRCRRHRSAQNYRAKVQSASRASHQDADTTLSRTSIWFDKIRPLDAKDVGGGGYAIRGPRGGRGTGRLVVRVQSQRSRLK